METKITIADVAKRIGEVLNERPYVETTNDEVIDFRIEKGPDGTPDERKAFGNHIEKGLPYYGKLGNKWILFQGENIGVRTQEPVEAKKMPDFGIKYVYIAI